MAGVLEQLIRPQKRAVVYCTSGMNPTELELQMAKSLTGDKIYNFSTAPSENRYLT